MIEFDFDNVMWLDPSVPVPGKPLSELAGPAADWFVKQAAAKGDVMAIEHSADMHAEFTAWANREGCASVRGLLTDLYVELSRVLDKSDDDLSDVINVQTTSGKTSVSARLSLSTDSPRGESGHASVSFKFSGALGAALLNVAPAAKPRTPATV